MSLLEDSVLGNGPLHIDLFENQNLIYGSTINKKHFRQMEDKWCPLLRPDVSLELL